MTTLIKFIIVLTLSLFGEKTIKKDLTQNYDPVTSKYTIVKDSTQLRAFEVLTKKCNVCHEKRNRRRVFTEDNMADWSNDVYKQVFIKKRMPKGKKIKLTSEEYQDLLTWISSIKNN